MNLAKTTITGALLAVALLAAPALAQAAPAPPAGLAPPAGFAPPKGYLPPGALDMMRILPPPPEMNSPRQAADQELFKATRKMKGAPRYALATADVALTPQALLDGFSCAAGVQLSPQAAPKLTALGNRMMGDTMGAIEGAKNGFKRPRPFLIDKGEVCEATDRLSHSFDYPSGHAVIGWTWAMLLADLIPERATDLLARGRAYAESRIVCGSHSASAVDAGQMAATAVMARLQASPEFRADLEAARAEVAALRGAAKAKDSAACAIEAEALASPLPR